MSIIHDALKKVQQKTPLTGPDRADPTAGGQPGQPASAWQALPSVEPAPGKPHPALIAFGVVISIVVIVILTILFRLAKEASRPPAAAPKSVVRTMPPATIPIVEAVKNAVAGPSASSSLVYTAPPAPSPSPTPALLPGEIRLEGVMDMGNKKVALINGDVYEEGQVVEGKIIAEIARNSITVMDNGTKKIIPLKK